MKPQPGDDAPDFSMQADDGITVSREPASASATSSTSTRRTTRPAAPPRPARWDNFERVMDSGVEVFGVSPDSVKSHVTFRAKYDLPYRLLADPDTRWPTSSTCGSPRKPAARPTWASSAPPSSSVPMGRSSTFWNAKLMEHVDLLLDALAA